MPALFLIPALIYLGLHYYLDSSASFLFFLLPELPLLLCYIEIRWSGRGRVAPFLSSLRWVLYSLLFMAFLLFILMLPESLYQGWLLLLDAGKAQGMISFAFAAAGGLVSSIACASLMLWKDKVQALVNLLILSIMVLMILHPRPWIIALFLLFLLLKLIHRQGRNPRAVVLISLSALLLPSLICAFVLPLRDDSPGGSRIVDRFSSGVQAVVARSFPGLPLFLQVPGYGGGYERGRKTGEPPVLSPRVLFTLEADPGTVHYLRSGVFYRYKEGLWLSEPPEAGVPLSSETGGLREIKLTVETDLYTRIPHMPRTLYYKRSGELTRLSPRGSFEPSGGLPLSRGETISLYNSREALPDDPGREGELSLALRVPGEMRKSLRALAMSLEGEDDGESLDNIRIYLREHYRYSLETEASDNMILDFLNESREGYCVHFSAAAAVLARILGIPVRLAEGFLVQIPLPPEGGSAPYPVTGYGAHQWPEIYREGQGWTPWEVTPPFDNLRESSMTGPPISPLMAENGSGDRSAEDLSSGLKKQSLLLPLILLSVVFSMVIFLIHRSRRNPEYQLKRKAKIIEGRSGILLPRRTGWIQWVLSLEERGSPPVGSRFLQLLLRYSYDDRPLDKGELREFLRLIRSL